MDSSRFALLAGRLNVDPYIGELIVRSSIRLAVGCYLVRVLVDLGWGRVGDDRWLRAIRGIWTAGCGLFLVHVVSAFAFVHAWSHTHAYQRTAEQTAAVTGIDWGGGLYFNYAFIVLWIGDVLAWWIGGLRFPYRSPIYFWTLQGVFVFMMLNATVVFGPPGWKWAGLAAGAAAGGLILWRKRSARQLVLPPGDVWIRDER